MDKKQKRRTSKVWRHFTDNVDDETADCNYCGKSFFQKEGKDGKNPGPTQ